MNKKGVDRFFRNWERMEKKRVESSLQKRGRINKGIAGNGRKVFRGNVRRGGGFFLLMLAVVMPAIGYGQTTSGRGLASSIQGLQGTLDQVFQTMLGMCGSLTSVGQSLAGFGALGYVSYKIWRFMVDQRELDVLALLRPFGIGVALVVYPNFIGLLNGVLQPTVEGTSGLVTGSNQAIATLLQQKENLLEQGAEWQMYVGPAGSGSFDKWSQYTGNTDNGIGSGFGLTNWVKFEMAKASYNIKNSFKVVLSQFLEVLYQAAALCVNTIRIFYLVVLAVVGPLALGLSVIDPFKEAFAAWVAKYIHVFLWLPVCNIFGAIINQVQEQMLKIDISQLQSSGQTWFGQTDVAYLVFLLMGTAGYFAVPSITQHIVTVFPSVSGGLTKVMKAAGETAGKAAAVAVA
jgi:conjugative transposon TraJ protein